MPAAYLELVAQETPAAQPAAAATAAAPTPDAAAPAAAEAAPVDKSEYRCVVARDFSLVLKSDFLPVALRDGMGLNMSFRTQIIQDLLWCSGLPCIGKTDVIFAYKRQNPWARRPRPFWPSESAVR